MDLGGERHEWHWVHLHVHSLNKRFSSELKNDPQYWAFSSQPQATNQFQNNPTYSDTIWSYSQDTWKFWHRTSVHGQFGHGDTNESVWQAAGADALRGAWQEHIPIQQSLRPLAYKLCRHASLESKENIQCSYRKLLKLLSPFQNFYCLWRMHASSTVLQCYGSPIKKPLSYKTQRV